jgi:alpha-ketoglutaric semialdehyde dehydrogenase
MTTLTGETVTLFGGEWRRSSGEAWLPVLDPADLRREVARVPALAAADLEQCYDGAEEGARIWRGTDPLARGSIMLATARLLRDRAQGIASDLVAEMGKTSGEALVEVEKAADFFEYYGSIARGPSGYTLNDARPQTSAGVRFEPVGIVLAITPWNDPLLTPARKLAPALYAGNAVILKPATDTPLVSLHLAHALLDAGLPPQVLSVVTGRGQNISKPLLQDPRLAAVSFTGSNAVGSSIMRALAGRNLRVQTEMGGKNATVVLADADLNMALETIIPAAFGQAGQRCTATSRLIIDRAVAPDLLRGLRDRVAAMRVGPGSDPRTIMGPVVNQAQRSAILSDIQTAVQEGCELLVGGHVPADEGLEHGCFVEPTLLTSATTGVRIWHEEVFGPVLCAIEVDGFDEACDAVNASAFGLSSAIFTTDLSAANRFMDRVETGQVAVNLPTSGWDVHHPFGGFRDSGSPFKEQGIEALHFYSRAKTYAVRYG